MEFRKKIDIRVSLARIDFTLTLVIFLSIIFSLVYKKFFAFSNILTAIIPLDFLSKQKICFFNSYLYLKYKGKEPSPIKDIPIKPQDIECYSVNNPFPPFNRCTYSGKNITLFLKNGKNVTFSAKEQEFFLINWLKENFIREEDKISRRGRIQTMIVMVVSLLELVFLFNLYKSGNMPKYGSFYLIASAVSCAYWLMYIISGAAIKAFVRVE